MPHQLSPPPGTRFFARLDKFHCECPACGTLIIAHKDGGLNRDRRAFTRRRLTQYNPITSTLYCHHCRRAFGVGLILWPLSRGGGAKRIPEDHRPTRRQIHDLAQSAYGLWAREVKRAGESLNVAIDQECICPQPDGWAPSCPVHPPWQPEPEEEESHE